MSESIKHECGIVLIRLLKPLEYYKWKYGSWRIGLDKLYLLMEKQHNRGQDGAGAVSLKIDLPPGKPYLNRVRSNSSTPIIDVFNQINKPFLELEKTQKSSLLNDSVWAKHNLPFAGELYLGHVRYSTFGQNDIEQVHPQMRENNWKTRNLVLAGNFNLTNVDELLTKLIELGQHPKDYSDTVTIMENMGHFLEREVQQLFDKFHEEGHSNIETTELIAKHLDVANVLRNATKYWDGGYVIGGLIGHGDAFVVRDPNGIRPAFYYKDDEFVVVTSERPVIQTALNVPFEKVKELMPGNAIIIKKDGTTTEENIRKSETVKACSFERIYFSRGSDADIYAERKHLGEFIVDEVFKAIDFDIKNTVFSYIPNTAETSFLGMINGVENYLKEVKKEKILKLGHSPDVEELNKIIDIKARVEKIAIKDAKLRTFISQDKGRNDLVGHVYDVTYGAIRPYEDNLVIIDDSIVRGTTLRESIINILDRLHPKKIVVVSSAPQIRYPDCYGIDMARLDDLIAFRATIDLLKETQQGGIINKVYSQCKEQENLPKEKIHNYVKEIYNPFTPEQISHKIAQMLRLDHIQADITIVYQRIENLLRACPNHLGDWYFTGNYPTPGGNRVVNRAFINFIENRKGRAY